MGLHQQKHVCLYKIALLIIAKHCCVADQLPLPKFPAHPCPIWYTAQPALPRQKAVQFPLSRATHPVLLVLSYQSFL